MFLPIAFYSVWIPVQTDVLESGVISIKDFNPFYQSAEGTYAQTDYPEDITFQKNTEPTLQEFVDQMEVIPESSVIAYPLMGEDLNILVKLDEAQPTEVENQEVETVEEVIPEEVTAPQPVVQPNSMNYIVGCFGNKANADNLVSKLKSEGMDAFILDVKGGLHRVSAGAALSNESIKEIKVKSQSLGFDGWILK
jgi:cell division septation protein DedD